MSARTIAVEEMESVEHEHKLVTAIERITGAETASAPREIDVLTYEGDAEDQDVRKAITNAGFKKGKL